MSRRGWLPFLGQKKNTHTQEWAPEKQQTEMRKAPTQFSASVVPLPFLHRSIYRCSDPFWWTTHFFFVLLFFFFFFSQLYGSVFSLPLAAYRLFILSLLIQKKKKFNFVYFCAHMQKKTGGALFLFWLGSVRRWQRHWLQRWNKSFIHCNNTFNAHKRLWIIFKWIYQVYKTFVVTPDHQISKVGSASS